MPARAVRLDPGRGRQRRPSDCVKVCADTDPARVTISKSLTLTGEDSIIEPTDGASTIAVRLAADEITLRGFTIQGASVGIDASDHNSGYRITQNLIQDNTLFGIDFGSAGGHESRVDHNDLHASGVAVVSELDDDSLWLPFQAALNVGCGTHATSRTLASTTTPRPPTTASMLWRCTSPDPAGAGT